MFKVVKLSFRFSFERKILMEYGLNPCLLIVMENGTQKLVWFLAEKWGLRPRLKV